MILNYCLVRLYLKFFGNKVLSYTLPQHCYTVSKDELKKGKIKIDNQVDQEKKSLTVKCYFVHIDPEKSISEARNLFMHVHTVPTLEKYMARLISFCYCLSMFLIRNIILFCYVSNRFSLILSKTFKLPIDFDDVQVKFIKDIPFKVGVPLTSILI